jgi:hypothetical protein
MCVSLRIVQDALDPFQTGTDLHGDARPPVLEHLEQRQGADVHLWGLQVVVVGGLEITGEWGQN